MAATNDTSGLEQVSGFVQVGDRWLIAARVAVAALGGFLWVSTAGALSAQLWALSGAVPLAQAVHVMTQLGYLFWCALAMWIFYERRLIFVAVLVFGSSIVMYGLHEILR